ncbi:hypothetical protein TNCV_1025421 [Trichonephila clavipes]|nr:hypothetical protein TNCV_1025421 [Trichonephila clavipes]
MNTKLAWGLNTGVTRQTNHLTGTSAHAPRDPRTTSFSITKYMTSLLKAYCRPPINDCFHSRCLLHSHWTSSSEVTPPSSSPSFQKTMNIRVPDRGLKAAGAA